MPDATDNAQASESEKKPCRLILCRLTDGQCLADVKLADTPTITGDRALLRKTLAHVLTLLAADE